MNYLSRKNAMAGGLNQYYTGKPCKSGHVSYRYTTSGACASCVAAARDAGRGHTGDVAAPVRVSTLEHQAVSPERLREYNSAYILIKLRVLSHQRPRLIEIMEAYNFARWPELPLYFHALGRPVKTESGTIVFEVRCHPEDEEALRAECGRLLAHAPRVAPPDWIKLAKDHGLDAQDGAAWPQGDPR